MSKSYEQIQVGDQGSFEKTITETDIYLFAGITGDLNPAHINQRASENSMFKGRIAHGMLSAGLISAVLGMELPGPGTIYLSQNLKFVAPVYIGDTIKAVAEVTEKMEKGRIKLKTTCYNQNDKIVLDGEAVVIAPKASC
ncbi:3-hydroxybutyryl-CoA dehydratase [Anaerosolibacter carboniphilus]|uniref:3-hydroxybutyryl-CoA dehydratase n=1 Tax=Anaerosolibacter carboniphilus TaxID=1417629 RepID=A0A841KQD2_9FIRM|nr:MaoC family dehydratase [Anaerosolibacter carboniphilus]MBB6215551.1 3-hydroxybutyryl-CoA dehydratase [Anaerosolibacter carboniphilus]